MRLVRRAYAVLISFVLLASSSAQAVESVVVLSMNDFTQRALENSLRSRDIRDAFESNRLGHTAGRRSLLLPLLDLSATKSIDKSDDDAGTEVEGKTTSGRVALSQPFLTGAAASVTADFTKAEDETFVNGATLGTGESRTSPALVASLTQPLYLFNGNGAWRAWKRNRVTWDISQAGFRDGLIRLQSDARSLYYQLIVQIESVAVERKKFDSSAIVLKTTRTLVRAGKLPEVELIRADIRAERDQRRIQNAQQNLEKSLNSAKDFLRIPLEANVRLTSPLVYEPFRAPLSALLKEAVENNLALRTARSRLVFGELDLADTREANRPQFRGFANYALTRDRSDGLSPRDPFSWSAGVNLNWSIFDATLTRLRTRQSELALTGIRRDFESTERQTRLSVENAYIDLKRTEEQINSFQLHRQSAQQNLRAMQLRYQNGLTRLTDVFDAENEVRDLELEYLGLLVDYNTSRDVLLVLVGRDLYVSGRTQP